MTVEADTVEEGENIGAEMVHLVAQRMVAVKQRAAGKLA